MALERPVEPSDRPIAELLIFRLRRVRAAIAAASRLNALVDEVIEMLEAPAWKKSAQVDGALTQR